MNKPFVDELNEATAILRLVAKAMGESLYIEHNPGVYTCPGCGSWTFRLNDHHDNCKWGKIRDRLAKHFDEPEIGKARP